MGYSYAINYKTGRQSLACDYCGRAQGDTIKVPCPVGYCPRVATCKQCRAIGKHKEYKHEQCIAYMAQSAKDKELLRAGGLTVTIARGDFHASEAVHNLYYIIEPKKYEWSDILGGGVWYELDELTEKLQKLGHTVQLVDAKRAQEIIHGQR